MEILVITSVVANNMISHHADSVIQDVIRSSPHDPQLWKMPHYIKLGFLWIANYK